MPGNNPLETGFELHRTYGAPYEFVHGLTDVQRADICSPNHVPYISGSEGLADAAWDLANYGDPTALTVLGIAAREDIPRSRWEYEAIPGYNDAPTMPKSTQQRLKTVFDFEREMLEMEETRFNTFIKLPAATAQRIAKRKERTPFDKA